MGFGGLFPAGRSIPPPQIWGVFQPDLQTQPFFQTSVLSADPAFTFGPCRGARGWRGEMGGSLERGGTPQADAGGCSPQPPTSPASLASNPGLGVAKQLHKSPVGSVRRCQLRPAPEKRHGPPSQAPAPRGLPTRLGLADPRRAGLLKGVCPAWGAWWHRPSSSPSVASSSSLSH